MKTKLDNTVWTNKDNNSIRLAIMTFPGEEGKPDQNIVKLQIKTQSEEIDIDLAEYTNEEAYESLLELSELFNGFSKAFGDLLELQGVIEVTNKVQQVVSEHKDDGPNYEKGNVESIELSSLKANEHNMFTIEGESDQKQWKLHLLDLRAGVAQIYTLDTQTFMVRTVNPKLKVIVVGVDSTKRSFEEYKKARMSTTMSQGTIG